MGVAGIGIDLSDCFFFNSNIPILKNLLRAEDEHDVTCHAAFTGCEAKCN